VEFVISLECQLLRTVLHLFDSLGSAVHPAAQLNKTDEQKMPVMQLTSSEMTDRFKKIIVTCVNFVLFSGQ